jgi:hypothetical protein
MVYRFFNILSQRGDIERAIGPAPEGLQGSQLDLQFNGILAQAQKMNRVQPTQFTANWVAEIAKMQGAAGMYPDVLDKFNMDQAIDVVASDMYCPASIIRSDDEVAAIRADRQKAQQAQQAMQAAPMIAKSAKDLSQAKLDDDSALGAMVKA